MLGSVVHLLNEVDTQLFLTINSAHAPWLDRIMVFLSYPGAFWVLPGLFVTWRIWKGDKGEKRVWIGLLILMACSDLICAHILKPLFHRPRPYLVLQGIHLFKKGHWIITTHANSSGFGMSLALPSCHAMSMWGLSAYLVSFFRRRGAPIIMVAAAVSYSRIYLGLHYPGDIAASMLFGSLLGILMARLIMEMHRQLPS